ncbi:hypothetical protein FRB91_002880 [Serendipita sp. 411]|nr:hypothetical protein FRB91_002880 [Serendipita sp. 411]
MRDSPNHRGAKPTPSKKAQKITWSCNKCGKSFASQSAMQQHVKSPFHAQRSAHCPHCRKKFKTASGVAHHLEHHFGNCRVSNVVRQWDTSGLISTQSYTSYTPTARIEAVSDSESSGSNSKHGSLALVKSQRPQQQQQQQKQQQQIKGHTFAPFPPADGFTLVSTASIATCDLHVIASVAPSSFAQSASASSSSFQL